MRRRRVKADVSKAAVVLTNPTHYAVALGFDFATMEAPKVLAKGRNLLAEEIKAEARWAGVPIIENPPLARSLYRSVEVGQAIPVDLYAAVAAILAYLYRQRVEAELRERRAREAAARAPGAGREAARTRPAAADLVVAWRPAAFSPSDGRYVNEHYRCTGTLADPAVSIWHRLREYRAAPGRHQRDLRHAGAAAGRGARLPAGALDGGIDHRLSLRGADSPRRRAFASFPRCCCCSPSSVWL